MHTLLSSQSTLAPTQAPSVQVSPLVQAFLSSHVAVFVVLTQPDAVSQLSVIQAFLSSHGTIEPTHLPAAQVSFGVQALPSSQAAVVLALMHLPSLWLQLSTVHWLLSLQFFSAPAHLPALHASLTVQISSSSQLALLGLPSRLASAMPLRPGADRLPRLCYRIDLKLRRL
ncbi:MAG: hypothetical protein EXR77_07665 [Myxococcales bacterium]|nr:hypothetical protein [Myxococcales bacterium]